MTAFELRFRDPGDTAWHSSASYLDAGEPFGVAHDLARDLVWDCQRELLDGRTIGDTATAADDALIEREIESLADSIEGDILAGLARVASGAGSAGRITVAPSYALRAREAFTFYVRPAADE